MSAWSRPPAIVLGCSPSGLGVIRALEEIGVPVVAVWHSDTEIAQYSRYVDLRVKAPDPDLAPLEYVETLLSLAERARGGLLVPTSDATVEVAARHKEALAKEYLVACVDWETADLFLDKRRTFELADEAGIPAPVTLEPDSLEEIEAARDRLTYPCVVKPRNSHLYSERFATKMRIADSFEEVAAAWREADCFDLGMVVQEFIPGPDTLGVNFNAYLAEGRLVAHCTAQKLRLAPPTIGAPRVAISRPIPALTEPSMELLRAMGFTGFANVEFKLDRRDQTFKLMEVNGRHNLSTLLSVRAGVNFPAIMYRHLIEGELPPSPPQQRNGDYWIALPSDPFYSLLRRGEQPVTLREFVAPYARPHVFDVLDLGDPKPFAASIAARIRRTLGRASGNRAQA